MFLWHLIILHSQPHFCEKVAFATTCNCSCAFKAGLFQRNKGWYFNTVVLSQGFKVLVFI